jgi:hypothetical protein
VTDDICGASLRGSWLEFSSEEGDRVDLARTIPGVPSSGPRSRPLVPPPAPARPPRITPASNSTPRKARWPLRLAFLASCFVAGLLLVRHLVADSAPARAEAKAGVHAGPRDLSTASAAHFQGDAEHVESDSASRAPVQAVPLDEVLGEAETVAQESDTSAQALAAKKRRPPSPSKKPAKSHKRIDFGF